MPIPFYTIETNMDSMFSAYISTGTRIPFHENAYQVKTFDIHIDFVLQKGGIGVSDINITLEISHYNEWSISGKVKIYDERNITEHKISFNDLADLNTLEALLATYEDVSRTSIDPQIMDIIYLQKQDIAPVKVDVVPTTSNAGVDINGLLLTEAVMDTVTDIVTDDSVFDAIGDLIGSVIEGISDGW